MTWVLRATSALLLLATLAQGLLAGLFVTGDAHLLTIHSAVGSALCVVALVQVVAAVLERRWRKRTGGPLTWRPAFLSGVYLAMAVTQIGLGMARVVAPHMFLGVTMAAVAMLVLLIVLTESVWVDTTAAADYTKESR
ncbi:hypothetical protein ACFOY2_43815 [Nonomuraea purpurea]|uniref:Cytochrome b561 domain-containing protein n=1 Tax=Nonomuraea purpurea TaxID=1849276 RepID=A0ABV8GPG7_9ACTN